MEVIYHFDTQKFINRYCMEYDATRYQCPRWMIEASKGFYCRGNRSIHISLGRVSWINLLPDLFDTIVHESLHGVLFDNGITDIHEHHYIIEKLIGDYFTRIIELEV